MDLITACKEGNLEAVKALVENGIDIDGKPSFFGKCKMCIYEKLSYIQDNHETPLHIACKNGFVEIAKFLLKNGADICNDSSIVYDTYKNNHRELARFLVENEAPITGDSLLIKVCINNDLQFTELLIYRGINVNNYFALDFVTDIELFKLLINAGADVNIKYPEDFNFTLLHFVKTVEKAKFLISLGLDLEEKGEDDATPFLFSVTGFNLELVKFYFDLGADKMASTNNGMNALHYLNSDYLDNEESSFEIFKLLLGDHQQALKN